MPWYAWLATGLAVAAILRTAWTQASAADRHLAATDNDETIRRRINQREALGAIARRRVEELNGRAS